MSPVVHTLIIGLLATAAMDIWGVARPLLGFPRTDYRLTAAGRRALERYLDHMEALIRMARG